MSSGMSCQHDAPLASSRPTDWRQASCPCCARPHTGDGGGQLGCWGRLAAAAASPAAVTSAAPAAAMGQPSCSAKAAPAAPMSLAAVVDATPAVPAVAGSSSSLPLPSVAAAVAASSSAREDELLSRLQQLRWKLRYMPGGRLQAPRAARLPPWQLSGRPSPAVGLAAGLSAAPAAAAAAAAAASEQTRRALPPRSEPAVSQKQLSHPGSAWHSLLSCRPQAPMAGLLMAGVQPAVADASDFALVVSAGPVCSGALLLGPGALRFPGMASSSPLADRSMQLLAGRVATVRKLLDG